MGVPLKQLCSSLSFYMQHFHPALTAGSIILYVSHMTAFKGTSKRSHFQESISFIAEAQSNYPRLKHQLTLVPVVQPPNQTQLAEKCARRRGWKSLALFGLLFKDRDVCEEVFTELRWERPLHMGRGQKTSLSAVDVTFKGSVYMHRDPTITPDFPAALQGLNQSQWAKTSGALYSPVVYMFVTSQRQGCCY